MQNYLITVRDGNREMECTTLFEGSTKKDAKEKSIEYFANELQRPP